MTLKDAFAKKIPDGDGVTQEIPNGDGITAAIPVQGISKDPCWAPRG